MFLSKEIKQYATEHTTPLASIFSELEKETYEKTEMPQMQSGSNQGLFLKMMIQSLQATRVLEVGTFTGYSALAMAEGLPADGNLITLDCDPEVITMAQKYWNKSEHGRKIKALVAPALDSLSSLEGIFDFAFIDADKVNYQNYWEAVLPKIRKGGMVAVDNVLWSGTVLDPQDDDAKAIATFNDTILKDKRVDVVMLTIRDGVTLARKK